MEIQYELCLCRGFVLRIRILTLAFLFSSLLIKYEDLEWAFARLSGEVVYPVSLLASELLGDKFYHSSGRYYARAVGLSVSTALTHIARLVKYALERTSQLYLV